EQSLSPLIRPAFPKRLATSSRRLTQQPYSGPQDRHPAAKAFRAERSRRDRHAALERSESFRPSFLIQPEKLPRFQFSDQGQTRATDELCRTVKRGWLRRRISRPAEQTPTTSTNRSSEHTPPDFSELAPARDRMAGTVPRHQSTGSSEPAEKPQPCGQFSAKFSLPSTRESSRAKLTGTGRAFSWPASLVRPQSPSRPCDEKSCAPSRAESPD